MNLELWGMFKTRDLQGIKRVLNEIPDINAESDFLVGTILSTAMSFGDSKIVSMVLEKNPDLTTSVFGHMNALDFACSLSNSVIFDLILERDPFLPIKIEHTPIDLNCKWQTTTLEIVKAKRKLASVAQLMAFTTLCRGNYIVKL